MRAARIVCILGVAFLLAAPFTALAQDEASDDSNNDMVENDGGRPAGENDGNDGDDTSVGANPPDAAVGCLSAYTYLDASPGVGLFKDILDSTDLAGVFRYRNFTGTIFVPTNFAIRNLADAAGVNLENGESVTPALARSIVQYHVLFDTLRATELAALAGGQQEFETTLSVAADGSNAGLATRPQSVFVRDPALTYQELTVTVASVTPGEEDDAPNGTYRVTAGASSASIVWDDTEQPAEACTAFLYRVDAVLLPAGDLAALGRGSVGAPAPNTGDGEGSEAESSASGDGEGAEGAAPPAGNDGEGAEGEGEGATAPPSEGSEGASGR